MPIKPSDAIPFSELAKQLPRKPSRGAVYYWWHVGLKNKRTGQRIKLEAVATTTGMGSTLDAYEEFLDRLS